MLEKKLLSIFLISSLVLVASQNAFAFSLSNETKSFNADLYNQMMYKIHTMISANKMNYIASQNLDKYIEEERMKNHETYQYYNNYTVKDHLNYINQKPSMSKSLSYQDLSQRYWYEEKTKQDKKEIFDMMKILKQVRINISDIKN